MSRPKLAEGEQGARERIMDAFWKFGREMPASQITVDTLAREAGCNRSTFYYHFDGIDDLRVQVIGESGLRESLAEEFLALLSGGVPGRQSAEHRADPAFVDDVCLMTRLNWGELRSWGVPDVVRDTWGKAAGVDPESLPPANRIALEFAVAGFLAVLAYRGGRGNDFPPEVLVESLMREVAPSLRHAVEGLGDEAAKPFEEGDA